MSVKTMVTTTIFCDGNELAECPLDAFLSYPIHPRAAAARALREGWLDEGLNTCPACQDPLANIDLSMKNFSEIPNTAVDKGAFGYRKPMKQSLMHSV